MAERLAWLLDGASESAILTDRGGLIEYVNPAFEALTGYRREEVLGRTPAILKSGMQPPEFYDRLWRTVLAGCEFRDVLVNRRKDGRLFHEEKTIRPLFDAGGRVCHLLSAGRDVSDRIAAMETLRHAALHDPLTGLCNRRCFMERMASLLASTRRESDRFTLALLDVDGFKSVNDRHGHAAGDAVLREMARRLRHAVREVDAVARLGGDEFALLLPGMHEPAHVEALLCKISDALRVPVRLGPGRELAVSVSIGACIRSLPQADGQRLLEEADRAMYRAKREGGPGFRLHRGAEPAFGRGGWPVLLWTPHRPVSGQHGHDH